MNRAIPGYYYDEEKKKYFKIEKSHTAPSSAAWSAKNVKRRKIESQIAKTSERRAALTKRHIKRSLLLRDPRIGGLLNRQLGVSEPGIYGMALAMDAQAGPGAAISSFRSRSSVRLAAPNAPVDVGCFWVQPSSLISPEDEHRVAYASLYDRPEVLGIYIPADDLGPGPTVYHNSFHRWDAKPTDYDGTVHSMSYCQRRNCLLMASNGDGTNHPAIVARTPRALNLIQHGPETEDFITVWEKAPTSALFRVASPKPDNTNCRYVGAVGMAGGRIGIVHDNLNVYTRRVPGGNSDVLSQTFCEIQPEVLYAGTRSGRAYRFDSRIGIPDEVFRHESAIAHLEPVDDGRRIIAAGPHSKMAIYDFRYLLPPPPGVHAQPWTQPVVEFPSSFRKEADIDFGFAVNNNLKVVTVSEEKGVQSYCLTTGTTFRNEAFKKLNARTMYWDGDELWVGRTGGYLSKYA